MVRRIQSGRKQTGYTLIELMIVMAIISIMVSIAVPLYQKALVRTKESLLKNNLFTLRTVIDEYTFDKKKAPQTLQDLVNEGYLRAVPMDPTTNSNQTWKVVMEDALQSVDQTDPGIFDVKSGSGRLVWSTAVQCFRNGASRWLHYFHHRPAGIGSFGRTFVPGSTLRVNGDMVPNDAASVALTHPMRHQPGLIPKLDRA